MPQKSEKQITSLTSNQVELDKNLTADLIQLIVVCCHVFVKSKSLTLRKNFSTNFALQAGLVAVGEDVSRVLDFADEGGVTDAAVEQLGATLKVKLGIVAFESGLALQVNGTLLAEEGMVAGTVLFGHVSLVGNSVL